MSSGESTTITLKKSTKARLESIKGKENWDSFLEELYLQKRKKEGTNSIAKLHKLLTNKNLKQLSGSSKKFRKELRLG